MTKAGQMKNAADFYYSNRGLKSEALMIYQDSILTTIEKLSRRGKYYIEYSLQENNLRDAKVNDLIYQIIKDDGFTLEVKNKVIAYPYIDGYTRVPITIKWGENDE